jgi:hypothetical protein
MTYIKTKSTNPPMIEPKLFVITLYVDDLSLYNITGNNKLIIKENNKILYHQFLLLLKCSLISMIV